MEFEATDIGCRIVTDEDHHGDVNISIKATVKNNSDIDEADVAIQGIDKDGFELVSVLLSGHVPISRTSCDRVFVESAYL